ncbi:hypothetical protein MA16_Dca016963 [Dendrobium catenatum]|uniref:Uncharacterized protein n=1 Tax=Dendrobium catenatum TaxID=906689 RepID=A0A2I0VWK5_9ASPA|nr:hypothetical protein MA16_Dca016963 [Dendrobium catenatum]
MLQENLVVSLDVNNCNDVPLVADKSLLSPNAIPFVPVLLDGGVRQGVILESSGIALVPEVDNVNVNVETSDSLPIHETNIIGDDKVIDNAEGGAGDDMLAGVEPSGIEAACPSLNVEEGIQIVNNVV